MAGLRKIGIWISQYQQQLTRPAFYRYTPLLVMGFIFSFAVYQSLHLFQYENFYDWTFLFLYLTAGFLVVFSRPFRQLLGRVDGRLALVVVGLLAVAIRLYFIRYLPTQPVFDYAAYQFAAEGVSRGDFQALKLLEGKPWGYPLLLGLIYRLVGVNLWWAQLLNVVLSLVSIGMLYLLVKRLVGKSYAILMSLAYALLPSQIFMNNVVNSEILFVALLLAGVYWSVRFMQELSWKSLAATGIFLGLAQVVRPVAMIYLLVFGGYLVLQMGPLHIRNLCKYAIVALLSFYLIMTPFLALKSIVYRQLVLWEKGTFGMVFVMGTNVESKGYWNQKDYDHLKDLLIKYNNDAERVNKEAFRLAIWRLSRSDDFKLMIPEKVSNMWAIDTFGFEWANNGSGNQPIVTDEEKLRIFRGVSQIYYTLILFMVLIAIIHNRLERDSGFRYFTVLFLTFVLLHIFIEVQGRYHMHLTPFFLVMAAYGFYYKDHRGILPEDSMGSLDPGE